jgi:predicted transcriptional regulator with HTH domain
MRLIKRAYIPPSNSSVGVVGVGQRANTKTPLAMIKLKTILNIQMKRGRRYFFIVSLGTKMV